VLTAALTVAAQDGRLREVSGEVYDMLGKPLVNASGLAAGRRAVRTFGERRAPPVAVVPELVVMQSLHRSPEASEALE